MTQETKVLPYPYVLKHSSIGYWIDGLCGYLFVGYFDNINDCMSEFKNKMPERGE